VAARREAAQALAPAHAAEAAAAQAQAREDREREISKVAEEMLQHGGRHQVQRDQARSRPLANISGRNQAGPRGNAHGTGELQRGMEGSGEDKKEGPRGVGKCGDRQRPSGNLAMSSLVVFAMPPASQGQVGACGGRGGGGGRSGKTLSDTPVNTHLSVSPLGWVSATPPPRSPAVSPLEQEGGGGGGGGAAEQGLAAMREEGGVHSQAEGGARVAVGGGGGSDECDQEPVLRYPATQARTREQVLDSHTSNHTPIASGPGAASIDASGAVSDSHASRSMTDGGPRTPTPWLGGGRAPDEKSPLVSWSATSSIRYRPHSRAQSQAPSVAHRSPSTSVPITLAAAAHTPCVDDEIEQADGLVSDARGGAGGGGGRADAWGVDSGEGERGGGDGSLLEMLQRIKSANTVTCTQLNSAVQSTLG
jgi:hypothetical protein